MVSYGERIARQRARTKAQRDEEAAQKEQVPRTRRAPSTPTVNLYPMRDESYDAMPGIDWSRASTTSISSELVTRLLDIDEAPLGHVLNMPAGTGKTAVAVKTIGTLQERSGGHLRVALIIPPGILKKNGWQKTITSWNEAHPDNQIDPVIIDTPTRFTRMLEDKQSLVQVAKALGTDPRHSLIVIDEVHGYKSPTSKRSKHLQKLNHVRRLGLTATPLSTNIPIETGAYLIFGSYYRNKTHYMDATGLGRRVGYRPGELLVYDNNGRISTALWPEYKEVSRQRREMFHVPDVKLELADMPNVDSELIQLPYDADLESDISSLGDAYNKRMFDSATDFCLAVIERINHDETRLDKLIELVKKHENEQPLVFYQHSSVRDAIMARLDKEGIGYQEISGRTQIEDVDFDDSSKVMIIQYQAGSEGIELKKSKATVFFENQTSPLILQQTRGRNVRMGSTGDVSHYYLLANTWFDDKVFTRVEQNEELTQEILEEIALEAAGADKK